MKIGFITDTHLTLEPHEPTISSLEDSARVFEEEGVQNVVFLGDLVHEGNPKMNWELLNSVEEMFDNFTTYFTPGNHDILEFKYSVFEEFFDYTADHVIKENNGKSLLLLDTISESSYQNVGYIDEKSLNLVEEKLKEGKDVQIFTHYPLQHTTTHSEVFDFLHERAFPVNKIELHNKQMNFEGNISHIVCGHLHPEMTQTVTGAPTEIPMTIIEPFILFEHGNGELNNSYNTSIDYQNLIFDFDI